MSSFSRAFALVICAAALLCAPARAAEPIRAYIGTDTPDPTRPAGGGENHGEGIYLVTMNPGSGKLSPAQLVAKTTSPIWMTIDQKKKILYTVGAVGFNGTKMGSVSAFAIDPQSGALTLINTVSSQGTTPAYISIDPLGKSLLVANYGGGGSAGSVAVLPILPNGGVGEGSIVDRPASPLNPPRAADNPPGNFAASDHRISHIHMIGADPSGRFVVADDAGWDRIFLWRQDPVTGTLSPSQPASFAAMPGSAPRHFVFAPGGRFFFQLHEQDSMLAAYDFDPQTGALSLRQKLSTLPPEFAGSNLGSELLISRNGRNLYASNRLYDAITVFSVSAKGVMKRLGDVATRGDYPRSIALDPSGRFIYSLNERGDSVTSFRVDPKTGKLNFTNQFLPLGSPVVMVFLQ